MTKPEELPRLIGQENHRLLLESLEDVFRTGYGQVRLEISNGQVQVIKTEVSRRAELRERTK